VGAWSGTPYGVRVNRIGSGPDWFTGVRIAVWRWMPSRTGTMTSSSLNTGAESRCWAAAVTVQSVLNPINKERRIDPPGECKLRAPEQLIAGIFPVEEWDQAAQTDAFFAQLLP
jgi:hypothetical protein